MARNIPVGYACEPYVCECNAHRYLSRYKQHTRVS